MSYIRPTRSERSGASGETGGPLPTGVCEINTHLDGAGVFQCPDPAPLISKLVERCPTAANKNECLCHRPIALTLRVSVNIDVRGDGVSPTLTASRMGAYFTDTDIAQHAVLSLSWYCMMLDTAVCEKTLLRIRRQSEAYKRGRIKRGCSQKTDLQIGGKTGPRHIQNTGRVP